MEKEQFMVAVARETRDRMDALRIVLGVSRAEVGRMVLEGGLTIQRLERANVSRLARLHDLARDCDTTWQALVGNYIDRYRTGGPGLEALEDNPYVTVGLVRASVPAVQFSEAERVA